MSHIKFHNQKLSMLVLATIAASLAACGGGGGGSGPFAAANTLTGVAVDGYLQGAIVFLDINRNGLADAGEPSTTTDLNGRYALDYSSVTGSVTGLPVVVTGGVDSDTGFAFAGKLSAPIESVSQAQVVTPMTTLVDAMVSQGLAADVPTAKQKVANALGLTVDQLATDPVAAIANNPGIYTTAVALQRSIQMLASANARTGESSHESQERVVRALATAIRSQTSAVDVSQLVASLPLQSSAAAQELASALNNSVRTGVNSGGHEGAKAALKAMDEVRTRMESDRDYSLSRAAIKIDSERGKSTSRPYYQLTQNSSSATAVNTIRNISGTAGTTRTQPINTAGRLLASNCFQCHGTGGVGGFDNIRGKEASEVREYLTQSANSSIMAAHAQGYTGAQLNSIITYLQQ
ncbi:MAG: c-type cytochrome [Betaproteobacteria bacterium]